MYKYILNKQKKFQQDRSRVFKSFAYKSEFIFIMWKCPNTQKQELIQENRSALEVQEDSCFIPWKI